MLTDKEFILLVRKHEVLYNNKTDIKDVKASIWQLISKECGLNSAELAEHKWKQLVDAYIKYLRTNITFPHANEMSFLQPHLIRIDSGMDEFIDQDMAQLKKLVDNEEAAKKLNTDDVRPPSTHLNDLTSLELIFIGYAKALQKMPPALRVATKRKIADIMDEAELKMDEKI